MWVAVGWGYGLTRETKKGWQKIFKGVRKMKDMRELWDEWVQSQFRITSIFLGQSSGGSKKGELLTDVSDSWRKAREIWGVSGRPGENSTRSSGKHGAEQEEHDWQCGYSCRVPST
jgi:hypothetical protein